MDPDQRWLHLVVGALAAWRVTHLFAYEDGPADIVVSFRHRLGRHALGRLIDCFNCLSVWISLPIAFFVSASGTIDVMLTWLALSGAACLLERLGGPTLDIHRLPDEPTAQEDSDVMLWTEETPTHKSVDGRPATAE